MAKTVALPPLERLRELLEVVPIAESQYGVQSGLVWRIKRSYKATVGSVAGCLKRHNLTGGRCDWVVSIDNRRYLVSRIVYYMVNEVDPAYSEVDHKDRNTLNNNRENLRLADRSLQGHNMIKHTKASSNALGVDLHRKSNLWRARIRNKGSSESLGYFICKIEAARVWNNKVIELGLDKLGKPLNDLEAIECDCYNCQR